MPTDAQRRQQASAHHAEVQKLNKQIALLEQQLAKATAVVNAAREAMDESFEAGNADMDISIPSHLSAALSMLLDEFDAAITSTQEQP